MSNKRDGYPKNDLPLELLKLKFRLIDQEIYEIITLYDQHAFVKAVSFLRGGYFYVTYQGNTAMPYHRIVWMLLHDVQIPKNAEGHFYLVDHFDGNPLNNKPWNLRLVTRLENRNNHGQTLIFS
jgi:hypothetical protein